MQKIRHFQKIETNGVFSKIVKEIQIEIVVREHTIKYFQKNVNKRNFRTLWE